MESVGLTDSLLYDLEEGDPTYDEMMCFVKGDLRDNTSLQQQEDIKPQTAPQVDADVRGSVSLNDKIQTLTRNLPHITLEIAQVRQETRVG